MLDKSKHITNSPWHQGELAIQERAGVVERMDGPGRTFVRRYMPDQHREFFAMLPLAVFGTVDAAGDVWATIRSGGPGFLHSPNPTTLEVDLPRDPDDPADAGFQDGDAIGMLGIQLETRRRNRLNGTVYRGKGDAFAVQVSQSFGNCPQYIQTRTHSFTRDPRTPSGERPIAGASLSERGAEIIRNAETFFVASYVDLEHEGRQVDVSHRGGKAGFVRIGDDGVLTVPDFAGNLFFNTLGNFLLNPRAGLVFIDFATGDLLQLTGRAEVVLDSPEIAAYQGAERLWKFKPDREVYRPAGLPIRWAYDDSRWSPNTLLTRDWKEAEQRLRAAALAAAWRPFRLVQASTESNSIKSLYLEPADGNGLVAFSAGQHLPIRVQIDGVSHIRRYTISAAPSDGVYRISVKKGGTVSAHLHTLEIGASIEVRAPAGAFTLDASSDRPTVLLAAGVGITPMISMLRHLIYEARRTGRMRLVWLFQGARTHGERPFAAEIASLAAASQGALRVTRALSTTEGAAVGRDYDFGGRIDMDLIRESLPFGSYDFYLCGPGAFMQSMYDGLRSLDVPDERIHSEAFGPSSLQRQRAPEVSFAAPATSPVEVEFKDSSTTGTWTPESGTLLEFSEAQGLSPEFGCRSGSCGACSTSVIRGEVTYIDAPTFPVALGQALICCAVPAGGTGSELSLAL